MVYHQVEPIYIYQTPFTLLLLSNLAGNVFFSDLETQALEITW